MTVEEQLKSIILERYKSVRAFTLSIGIPYTTLDSVFKRGIQNAGIGTMLKVFDALNLDIESVETGKLKSKEKAPEPEEPVSEAEIEEDAIKLYNALRSAGIVKEGQALTPRQIDILDAVLTILAISFE